MLASLQLWARANPLLVLAVAACAGIVAAERAPPSVGGAVIVAAFVLSLAALLRPRAWTLLAACVAVFGLLHATRLDETYRHPLHLALEKLPDGTLATVQGSLVPDFDTTGQDRVSVRCEATRVVFENGDAFVIPTLLRLRMPPGAGFPGAGLYELSGLLHLPRANTTPGAFNAADFALRAGFAARMDVETIRPLPGRGAVLRTRFLERAEACRQWMSRELTRDLGHDPRTAGVIRAMALGVAEEAQDEIEDAFRNSGTLHVFAVSGLHVALLGLIAWEVLKLAGIGRRPALWCLLLLVFGYAFITGWRPSAARAAFMVAAVLAAPLMDRQAAVQNSLGLAALLLLAADTHLLFNPGFQLSFGVLWAIAAWADHVIRPLRKWTEFDPFLPAHLAGPGQRFAVGWRRWLGGTLSVSTSAWAGSAVFILIHFQSVTPVSILANCVLVPLSVLSLGVTCLSAVTALVGLHGAQIMINNANWLVAQWMIGSATWFAALPWGNFHLQPSSKPVVASVTTLRVLDMPDPGAAANHLRVQGTDWLLDTGPADTWRTHLKPYLRSQGINSLRGVILSHNDADHVGAVESVARAFHAPELFCSTREPGRYDAAPTTIRRLLAGDFAARLHAVQQGASLWLTAPPAENARATCLHPGPRSIASRGDDRAMVLMLHLGPWRVLWMSDAGWRTESELVAAPDSDLRCDVIIQNRHESDDTGSHTFLDRAQPRVVITFSHPRQLTLRRSELLTQWCAAHHVPVLDTWDVGSVLLELEADQLRVTPARAAEPVVLTPSDQSQK